jgi:replication-associated recombination protein RarA
MKNIKSELFWYKYQPKTLKQIILLPRIRKLVENGLDANMIFYSDTPGTGKSTLARILCKDTDNIEFNASKDTSVNILREQLQTHCKNLNPFMGKNAQKTIFLDEFDGVSAEYKKAMKGFSDTYQHVRFILTTNFIQEIDDKILSRFIKVDFNPKNKEEIDYLQDMYIKYLKAISINVKLSITDEELKKLIMLSFPDLRSATQKLQEIYLTKNTDQLKNFTSSGYNDIFDFVLNGKNNIEENYHFVINNFQDNPLELMKALGRPLFNRLMSVDNDNLVKKGATLINLQKSYNEKYTETIDPIIHLISYITDIKEVLK